MKIKTELLSDGQISFYLVTRAGVNIGMLRKGKNDRYTTCPWQPMTMNNEMLPDPDSPSGYMACYGSTGRADAIAALVARV